LAFALAVAFVTSAAAQTPSPSSSPEPQDSQPAPSPTPPAPVKYYLEIDQGDLNAISQALIELPKKVADPLILKLNAQLQRQDDIRKAAQTADAAPVKPKGKSK
jgi:hypothetical protein